VFTGTIAPKIETLHKIGPGTQGRAECLNQGDNLFYLAGPSVTTSDSTGQYTLTLSFTPDSYKDGCDPVTGAALTRDGQPAVIRTATLTKPSGTAFNGSYHLFNVNTIPEPDTLFLLFSGALAAVSMRLMKRRKVS
jgi:hypothetical protein